MDFGKSKKTVKKRSTHLFWHFIAILALTASISHNFQWIKDKAISNDYEKNKVSIYYGMNKIGKPLTTKSSGA